MSDGGVAGEDFILELPAIRPDVEPLQGCDIVTYNAIVSYWFTCRQTLWDVSVKWKINLSVYVTAARCLQKVK